jgi:FtsH-binding integral membrane protein
VRHLATEPIAPAREESLYFAHTFGWMAAALAVTGGVAAAVGHSERALHALLTGSGGLIWVALVVVQILLVTALVGLVQHMDVFTAAATFLAYAGLTGVTVSVIFAVFTTKSIFATFLITAAMFGALAVAGYTTDLDLTSWGSFLGMVLFGQLVGLVVNLFWLNEALYWLTTAVGVLLFSAYTAYDVQKLKQYEVQGGDPVTVEKESIVGALALYLDFVNLFLYLVRLFGRRR